MIDQTVDQGAIQLQLQDILTAAQAIALASSRGAFRAEEFSKVGAAYDNIIAFLQASGAITAPTADAVAPVADAVAPAEVVLATEVAPVADVVAPTADAIAPVTPVAAGIVQTA
jgi:hypothetical protein